MINVALIRWRFLDANKIDVRLHTTLLQNNSILSSGGTWEPSELLSFWFDCDALLLMALTPDSAPKILSSTCSHTFRHCKNSLATRRSCEWKTNQNNALAANDFGRKKIEAYLFHSILFDHLRMWQKVKWNFQKFRNGLFDDDFRDPRRNGLVQ